MLHFVRVESLKNGVVIADNYTARCVVVIQSEVEPLIKELKSHQRSQVELEAKRQELLKLQSWMSSAPKWFAGVKLDGLSNTHPKTGLFAEKR